MANDPIVPLRGRYASSEMKNIYPLDKTKDFRYQTTDGIRAIFCEDAKFLQWRDNWIALAEAEKELGLNITQNQIEALHVARDFIDHDLAKKLEKELKHDVMAYAKEYGIQADKIDPNTKASGIIHLGATSCYITDHEELLSMRKGLRYIVDRLNSLNEKFGNDQLSPVIEELNYRANELKARGAKGTTGTQASYLGLFHGDHQKVQDLDKRVSQLLGFEESYPITSQTYNRLVDYQVLSSLALAAKALYNIMENDHPKKNVMRMNARGVYNHARQAASMASEQWLERSLDDSAERRIIIPESFYHLDYMITLITQEKPENHVTENGQISETDRKGLELITHKLANAIDRMHGFAHVYRNTICTAYTHGQFAQPTTYGKRIDLWTFGFALALKDIEHLLESDIRADHRLMDYMINSRLNQVAIAAAKTALDIRLLQHDLEVNEPFGKSQVGSSAMAYKKNPMKDERIDALSRNKIGAMDHASLSPYDFLNTDAILELVLSVFSKDTEKQRGFTVHALKARKNLEAFMPFLAAEDIMLKATEDGGNRQELHEKVRLASLAARDNIDAGRENNVLELMKDAGFDIDLARKSGYLNPDTHVGRSREQVDDFGREVVVPIRDKYKGVLGKEGNVQV